MVPLQRFAHLDKMPFIMKLRAWAQVSTVLSALILMCTKRGHCWELQQHSSFTFLASAPMRIYATAEATIGVAECNAHTFCRQ